MATAPMAAKDAAVNSLRFMLIVLLTRYCFDDVMKHSTYAPQSMGIRQPKSWIGLKSFDSLLSTHAEKQTHLH
jgi:hypothetical protein